jgi:CubicO group peptidase (beta-lactamase class C family)
MNGKIAPALDWDMSWAGGAGSLYSTVGDLFRWNEAFFGGRVVNETSFKAATTPVQLPSDADGMRYGFGQLIFTVKGLPAIGHGGGLNGWVSDLLRLSEQHCTVVALSNAMPPLEDINPAKITRSLAEQFLADDIKNVPVPTEVTSVDPKAFKDYVGQYDYRMGIMTIAVEGDALFGQLTDQPRLRLWPKAKDEFFPKEVDAQLVFSRDEKGRVFAIRHTQNGQAFHAPRIGEPAAKLTFEQLDAIVGQYQYGPNAVLTVTRDGPCLFAQLTGQPKCPIFAKSKTEFEWHITPAMVQFITGENGNIAKAVHTQNGRTFEAPRIKREP